MDESFVARIGWSEFPSAWFGQAPFGGPPHTTPAGQGALAGRAVSQPAATLPGPRWCAGRQSPAGPEPSDYTGSLQYRQAIVVPAVGSQVPATGQPHRCEFQQAPPAFARAGSYIGPWPSPPEYAPDEPPRLTHYSHSAGAPLPSWIRRVQATCPFGLGVTAVFESGVCPGTVLGSRFFEAYRNDSGDGLFEKALAKHVPDLAHSTLTNAMGERLFSGLHHGFIGVPGLGVEWLREQSDDRLKALLGSLCAWSQASETKESREGRVEEMVSSVRESETFAVTNAGVIQRTAARHMVAELAAAALLTDLSRLRTTCRGTEAVLPLLVIALVGQDDLQAWEMQCAACFSLRHGGPIDVVLRPTGESAQLVLTDVQPRLITLSTDSTFDVSAAERRWGREWAPVLGTSSVCERLLGPPGSRSPQGLVGECIRSLEGAMAGTVAMCRLRNRMWLQAVELFGVYDPRAVSQRVNYEALERETARLEKRSNTLKSAWRQLRGFAANWAAGPEISLKVGARLALIGHLVGEMPLISCSAGDDRLVQQLDAEVKFLAAAADSNSGHLPPIDADMGVWGRFRSAFDSTPDSMSQVARKSKHAV